MKKTIFRFALNAVWLAVALLAPILCAQRQVTGLVVQSRNYNPETKRHADACERVRHRHHRVQHLGFRWLHRPAGPPESSG